MGQPAPDQASLGVYRLSAFWRFVLLAFAAAAMAGGGVGIWHSVVLRDLQVGGRGFLTAINLGCLASGLYLLARAWRARVVVSRDRIRLVGVSGARSLRREEILGYRARPSRFGLRALLLVPRGSRIGLRISGMFRRDAAFQDWLAGFPDLDIEAAGETGEGLESCPGIEGTAADRAISIERVRRTCRRLVGATVFLCLWGLVSAPALRVVDILLVASTWGAVYVIARHRKVVPLSGENQDPRPGLEIAFVFSQAVLLVRASNDLNMILTGWQEPLILAFVVGFILAFAAWWADARLLGKPRLLLLLMLLCLGHGYAGVRLANALLERTPPTVFRTAVTGKYVLESRNREYHYVRLAPWGPRGGEAGIEAPDRSGGWRRFGDSLCVGNLRLAPRGPESLGERFEVTPAFYSSKRAGDPVCVELHRGVLGIPWYAVSSCGQGAIRGPASGAPWSSPPAASSSWR